MLLKRKLGVFVAEEEWKLALVAEEETRDLDAEESMIFLFFFCTFLGHCLYTLLLRRYDFFSNSQIFMDRGMGEKGGGCVLDGSYSVLVGHLNYYQ